MGDRSEFAKKLADLGLSHRDRAIAFIWYYRYTQEYEERTASELAIDLQEEGFAKPNVTRINNELKRSQFTVRGSRANSFQINLRYLSSLDKKYKDLLSTRHIEVSDTVLPQDWVKGTRVYLERLVYQINGSYQYGFFDACAVLCRRLMESLIIEVYISSAKHHEIQANNVFFPLDRLISYLCSDTKISVGRNSPKTMNDMKQLGDNAAHDRTYITPIQDINDIKAKYRRLITELLGLAGIR